jgi:hypothetical protein
MRLRQWRTHMQFLAAVHRASLPFRSKLRLYRYVSERMRWDRAHLFRELIAYFRTFFR